MHKRQPSAKPAGGPMRSLAPARRGGAPQPSSTRHACCSRFRRPFALHCRAGVHARRGALRQPERILARQGTAPLSRLTPPAPLTGEPFRRQAFDKASPARGGVTEGDGGVHCHFASEISCKPRQNPALCFVGDDLRAKGRHFVLCAPKRRLRAAVLASPRKTLRCRKPRAAGENARPTLRPRVGGNA